ncbi:MAG: TlpA family protein disulfide reductase [Acidobacteria bacterium]|nr:TlpA family protein disulfide reductase [Acidobacteriota bacterium]MBI3487702.1 TlpA family protein disulfide reductase [Acidobacteriota bacterium]
MMNNARKWFFVLLASSWAMASESPAVAVLAKEGHWLETGWAAHEPMLGKKSPGLELTGWLNGEVKPAAMAGKIVVVDFWATWCGPCRASVPHNNELVRKYAAKGVVLFGACGSGRGEEKMEEVAKATGLAYPTARVAKASTTAWNVQWWPTYAVIDRKGTLRAIGLKPDYVEKVIEALLVEQP